MREYWNKALKEAASGKNIQNVLNSFVEDANRTLGE